MASSMEAPSNNDGSAKERRRKRRWGAAAAAETATTTTGAASAPSPAPAVTGPVDSKAKAMALKASIAARLAALKSKTSASASVNGSSSNNNKRSLPLPPPPPTAASASASALSSSAAGMIAAPVAKRAKHYELDMTVTGPTFKKSSAISKPKPKLNPYLAHRREEEEEQPADEGEESKEPSDRTDGFPAAVVIKTDPSENRYVDARLEAAGHDAAMVGRRHRRRELRFVEPGTFIEIAERKRQRAANAESAGFASGRKAGQYFRSATMGAGGGGGGDAGNYYGTTEILDDVADKGVLAPRAEIGGATLDGKPGSANSSLRAMPLVVEWWDMELLPSKLKKQVANHEGTALSKAARSQMQRLSAAAAAVPSVVKKEEEEGGAAEEGTTEGGEASAATVEPTTTDDDDKARELRTRCSELASLSYSKTASLVQHIVPIPPPGDAGKKPAEPVLHLTKKERKRARKRRREQKQRELQDLQAAGLAEPPEPRLTLQNFIRVMGDQAYVDPSQMERKVTEQVQKRQRAHLERNAGKKLTREQKAAKVRGKVERDATPSANATGAIHVALFYVKNASHPYHRTKLDLNAQQLSVTGGVLECDVPRVSCVICEGGPKAIQKYRRLMLVRMKWKGPDDGEEEDSEDDEEEEEDLLLEELAQDGGEPRKKIKHRFDRDNRCELVWTGMATKRQFKGFVFQHCETSAHARKILKSKGVGLYWDQVLAHASGTGESMNLKLVDSDDEDEDEMEVDAGADTTSDAKMTDA